MRALLVLLLLISVFGCGQKGALVAPEDPPAAVQATDDDEDDEADAKARRRGQP